jgi:hypothetical protein
VDDDAEQEARAVDRDVALSALDLLGRVVATWRFLALTFLAAS